MLNLYLLGPQAFCFFNLLFSKNKTAIYLVPWHHSMIINFRMGSTLTTIRIFLMIQKYLVILEIRKVYYMAIY